jgi:hypothetical protein
VFLYKWRRKNRNGKKRESPDCRWSLGDPMSQPPTQECHNKQCRIKKQQTAECLVLEPTTLRAALQTMADQWSIQHQADRW